jgi:hypothetical protein
LKGSIAFAASPVRIAAQQRVQRRPPAWLAVDRVAPKGPAPFLDPQQVQQIAVDLAALRQIVEQIAANQTKMAAEVNNLLVTDMEMFLKIPAPAPQPPGCPLAQVDAGPAAAGAESPYRSHA